MEEIDSTVITEEERTKLAEEERLKLHYEFEGKTLTQLLILENEFRDHNELTLKEMQKQKEIIDRMWILSQRYIILVSTGPCCKYPEIYSAPAEDVVLHEYHEKLRLLRASNCRLWKSLQPLRVSCRRFEDYCSHLDMTVESPFILGDTFHKPIAYFIELVSDVFKYFHAEFLKFKYRVSLFDPEDSTPLEEYKKILEPSEDFQEYLLMGLTYCKCLRPKPICVKTCDG